MCRALILIVAAWGVVAVFARPASGQGDGKASIEKLVSAWTKRGEKVKSMVLELDFKKTIKAGELISPEAPENVLERDFTYSGERFVWLDGEKMRDHLVHITWDAEQGTYIPLNQTYLFDGEFQWSLFEYPERKLGFVHRSKENLYRTVPDFGPLFQQYLGFTSPALILNSIEGEIARSEAVDGRQCMVIEQGGRKYWIDPARGWHIVRHEWALSPERGRVNTTIDYTEDEQWGWVLKAWQVDFWRPQRLEKSTKWTVRSIKLNAEIDPAKFQMEFPPDTNVQDNR